MAARYWVGGAGTWSSTNTANWSATSGGAGGASVPTSADTPTFDGNSGSGVVTFTNGGVTVGLTTLNNANIELSLGAAFASGIFNVTAGTFTTNNYSVTAVSLNSTGVLSRSITLGSSTVTLSSTGTILQFTPVGLVFDCGTSSIVGSSSTAGSTTQFSGGGQTFYNLSFTSSNPTTVNFQTYSNTFNNVTIAGRTSSGIKTLQLEADQVINGTFTVSAGTNATMRTFVRSNVIGTARTLTCAAVSSLTDIDFRDITITGTAVPVSGTRLGDCKGNSGITFDAGVDKYWNLTTGGNWSAIAWATTSGGTPAVNNFPLAQDTAIFQATKPGNGGTVSFNAVFNIGTIDMSARTANTMTLATELIATTIYGNWINGTGTTLTGTGRMTFAGRGSQLITSAGKTFTQPFTIDTPGGSVTLQDAFTTATTPVFTQGTFSAATYNVTLSAAKVAVTGSGVRTIDFGSGTWTFGSGGNCWVYTGTNLTVTGTGVLSLTSASSKNFGGGNIQTYPTISQGGAGTLNITGSNKFANITNTAIAPVLFSSGATNIFDAFNLNGAAGNLLQISYIVTGDAPAQTTLQKSTAWKMGANSTDSGNNTGLSFTAGGGIDYLNVSYVNGTVVGGTTSNIYYGSVNITAIYYGSTAVSSLYYGSTQVF